MWLWGRAGASLAAVSKWAGSQGSTALPVRWRRWAEDPNAQLVPRLLGALGVEIVGCDDLS